MTLVLLSVKITHFDGSAIELDAKVKVLYGSDGGDIVSQYVAFTKVYDEQRKLHGRTRKTVTETIRICKDKNVLREYLSEREKEGAQAPGELGYARTETKWRREYYVGNV